MTEIEQALGGVLCAFLWWCPLNGTATVTGGELKKTPKNELK